MSARPYDATAARRLADQNPNELTEIPVGPSQQPGGKQETARRLERLSEFYLEEEPPQLVGGLIQQRGYALWYGRYGTGKTYVTMSLIYAIAAGHSAWAGLSLGGISDEQRNVIYLAVEGWAGPRRRLMAIAGGEIPEEVRERLIFYRHTDVNISNDERFRVGFQGILDRHCAEVLCMSEKQFLQAAIQDPEKRRQHGACLLVVDTLSRATPGMNENDAGDVNELVRVCDRLRHEYGLAVLLIHHGGKNPDRGSRGSSALPSAVDVALEFSRDEDLIRVRPDKDPKEEVPREVGLRFKLKEVAYQDPVTQQEARGSKAVAITALRKPEIWERLVLFVHEFSHADDERGPKIRDCAARFQISRQAVHNQIDRHDELESYQAQRATPGQGREKGFRVRLTEIGSTTAHRLLNAHDIDWPQTPESPPGR